MPRTNDCLHCAIMETVSAWFHEHGDRHNGVVVFDTELAIQKLTECVAQVAEMPDQASQRRRAFRFAHDALDANLKAIRTGESVAVEIPLEN